MKKCLFLIMAVAAFATGFTLCSCGGGGDSASGGGYAVTNKQFANGSKTFYILANNLWTLRSTGSVDGLIMSGPDNYTGTVACWGEITTGSYDKDDAGHAVVLFHYNYNKEKNEGILEWSWDAADTNNVPTAALAFITTIHTIQTEDGGGDEEEGNNGGGATGTGDDLHGVGIGDDPVALAEHYRQLRLELNFNTGMCVMYCGCGAYTQNLHFDVRTGS